VAEKGLRKIAKISTRIADVPSANGSCPCEIRNKVYSKTKLLGERAVVITVMNMYRNGGVFLDYWNGL
jgi:hypothetical protein